MRFKKFLKNEKGDTILILDIIFVTVGIFVLILSLLEKQEIISAILRLRFF